MKAQPQIHNDILTIKAKMEEIEITLEGRIQELAIREEKFKQEDDEVEKLFKNRENNIIRFNVGGKKFSTRLETLSKRKDHLLYKIIASQQIIINEEIYLERSPLYFAEVLNFLRLGLINMKKFSNSQLEELLEEAEFFELTELENIIKEELKDIKFINYQISSLYTYSNEIIGNPELSLIDIEDSGCGFLANYPNAVITFELDREYEVNKLQIKGYTDPISQNAWNSANGSGAEIHVSRDGYNWVKTEAIVPYDFGTIIKTVTFEKSSFRFIKFQHPNGYVGMSYLKLFKAK